MDDHDEEATSTSFFLISLLHDQSLTDETLSQKISEAIADGTPNVVTDNSLLFQLHISDTAVTSLSSLPRVFEAHPYLFNSLTELRLDNNALQSLPSVPSLPSLRLLDISHNQLSIIPDWIAECQRLTILHLHDNNIAILPHSFLFLGVRLQLFSFRNNPLPLVPQLLQAQGIRSTLEFLVECSNTPGLAFDVELPLLDNQSPGISEDDEESELPTSDPSSAFEDSFEITSSSQPPDVTTSQTLDADPRFQADELGEFDPPSRRRRRHRRRHHEFEIEDEEIESTRLYTSESSSDFEFGETFRDESKLPEDSIDGSAIQLSLFGDAPQPQLAPNLPSFVLFEMAPLPPTHLLSSSSSTITSLPPPLPSTPMPTSPPTFGLSLPFSEPAPLPPPQIASPSSSSSHYASTPSLDSSLPSLTASSSSFPSVPSLYDFVPSASASDLTATSTSSSTTLSPMSSPASNSSSSSALSGFASASSSNSTMSDALSPSASFDSAQNMSFRSVGHLTWDLAQTLEWFRDQTWLMGSQNRAIANFIRHKLTCDEILAYPPFRLQYLLELESTEMASELLFRLKSSFEQPRAPDPKRTSLFSGSTLSTIFGSRYPSVAAEPAIKPILSSQNSKLARVLSLELPHYGNTLFAGSRLGLTDERYAPFREAGMLGNIKSLSHMLTSGAIPTIDVAVSDGRTFLHLVLTSSSVTPVQRKKVLKFCCKTGVTKDLRDQRFNTGLSRAAQLGCLVSYRQLSAFGFSQFCNSETGHFPFQELLLALNSRTQFSKKELGEFKKIVKILVKNDAFPSLRIAHFCTNPILLPLLPQLPKEDPLICFKEACASGDIPALERLCATHPGLPMLRDLLGLTGAAYAVFYSQLGVLRWLLNFARASLLVQFPNGVNLLLLSILYRKSEITSFLMTDLPSLMISQPFSPLHCACLVRNEKLVSKLLELNANSSGTSDSVISPLFCACLAESPKIIRHLLSAGASALPCNLTGFAPEAFYGFLKNQHTIDLHHLFDLIYETDTRFLAVSRNNGKISLANMRIDNVSAVVILSRLSLFNLQSLALSSISFRSNNLTKIPLELLHIASLNDVSFRRNPMSLPLEAEFANSRTSYLATIKPYLLSLDALRRRESALSHASISIPMTKPSFLSGLHWNPIDTSPSPVFSLQLPIHGTLKFATQFIYPEDEVYEPFRVCARHGSIDVLALFLTQRRIPSIDVALFDGRTFLHLLFQPSIDAPTRASALSFCFDNNVSKDVRDHRFATALHRAAQLGCVQSFYSLIRYGFDPMVLNEAGNYPIELLIKHIDLSGVTPEIDSLFTQILRMPHSHRIIYSRIFMLAPPLGMGYLQMILNRMEKCDPVYQTICDFLLPDMPLEFSTPAIQETLMQHDMMGMHGPARAVILGSLDVLRTFSAALTLLTADGLSLLHLGTYFRRVDICHYLIEHAPSLVSSRCRNGFTPLHVACLIGDHILITNLLLAGAEANPAGDILSPLMCACVSGWMRAVEVVLSFGGNTNETDRRFASDPYAVFLFFKGIESPHMKRLFVNMQKLQQRLNTLNSWQTKLSLSGMQLDDQTGRAFIKRIGSLKIPHLTGISLRNNLLTRIPPELLSIPSLSYVNLSHNPIKSQIEAEYICSKHRDRYRLLIRPYLQNMLSGSGWHFSDKAAYMGSWVTAQKYIKSALISDIRDTNPMRETVLHKVCQNPRLSVSKRINFITDALTHGADANTTCFPLEDSPLLFAARLGCVETVKVFLERGASPMHRNLLGENFLYILASLSDPPDPSVLLEVLAKKYPRALAEVLNAPSLPYYMRPIHLAIAKGKAKFRNALMRYSAVNLCLHDAAHRMPMDLARSLDNAKFLKLMTTRQAPDHPQLFTLVIQNPQSLSIAFSACIEGKESLLKHVLSSISFENIGYVTDANGMNLFHHAALWGHYVILKELILKAESEQRESELTTLLQMAQPAEVFCGTPLLIAVQNSHVKIVELLLKYCNPNTPVPPFNLTPLIAASMKNTAAAHRIVELLLDAGADPSASMSTGETAMHHAVAAASIPTVASLLSHDLTLLTKANSKDLTPLQILSYQLNQEGPQQEQFMLVQKLCRQADSLYTTQVRPQLSKYLISIVLQNTKLPHHQLVSLITGLRWFPFLRHLDLCHNELTHIPAALLHLPQLRTLNCLDNPRIQCAYEKKLIATTNEYPRYARYLQDSLTNPPISSRFLKVVICGRECSGKTSLSMCLTKGKHHLSPADREYLLSTDGVSMNNFQLGSSTIALWDFAGQTLYETIHQFMLSQSILYIITWDLRQPISRSEVYHWCHLLKAKTQNIRVIIIGTHIDLLPTFDQEHFHQTIEKLQSQFYFILGSQIVSTVSGHGIPEFRQLLTTLAASDSTALHFSDQLISDQVDASLADTSVLPIVRFEDIYRSVSSIAFFSSLNNPRKTFYCTLQVLHRIGKILFFSMEKPIPHKIFELLSESFVVLNPGWLAELMTSVISTKLSLTSGSLSSSMFAHMLGAENSAAILQPLQKVLTTFGVIVPLAKSNVTEKPADEDGVAPGGKPMECHFLLPTALPHLMQQDVVHIQEMFSPQYPQFWIFERYYVFEWFPIIFFNQVVSTLLGFDIFGGMASAWRSAVLFKGSQVHPTNPDGELTYAVYLDHLPSVETKTTLRFICRVQLDSNTRATLRIASQLLRSFNALLKPLVDNLFPGSPCIRTLVPCPGCPFDLPTFDPDNRDTRNCFSLDECTSALAVGCPGLPCARCAQNPDSRFTDFLFALMEHQDASSSPYEASPFPLVGATAFSLTFLVPDYTLCDFSEPPMKIDALASSSRVLGVGGSGRVLRVALGGDELNAAKAGSSSHFTTAALKLLDKPSCYLEFIEESLLLHSLSCPYIVRLLGYTLQPSPGLLLEYLTGGDLYQYIHDPWRFKSRLSDLYLTLGQRLIARQQALRHVSEECWRFESCFSDQLHALRSLQLPTQQLNDRVTQIVTAAAIYWKNPLKETMGSLEELIDAATLTHLELLQTPEFRIPTPVILRVALELSRALHYLHSLVPPIVHLDVKTLNVIFTSRSRDPLSSTPLIKLADLGSARVYLPNQVSQLCLSSGLDLAPRWAAPEVQMGSFHPRSDIWGWGLAVWELYSRELPFDIHKGAINEAVIKEAVLAGQTPLIPSHIPRELADILYCCWDANITARPSADELSCVVSNLISRLHKDLYPVLTRSSWNINHQNSR